MGVGFPAGIKTAYSVPTKTKRLSYRGLEKGVTLDDGGGGVGGDKKKLDPSDETHRSGNASTYCIRNNVI